MYFFCIYNKGFTPEKIDLPTSSFDVLPTLLNVFGIEYDSRVLCGKDAFAPGKRLVLFSDGSFITEVCSYKKNDHPENSTANDYIIETEKKIR